MQHYRVGPAVGVVLSVVIVGCASRVPQPRDVEALPEAGGRIRVEWSGAGGANEGYVLERRTGDGPWQVIAGASDLPAGATRCVDEVDPAPRHHAYRLASVRGSGQSAWSETTTAVPAFSGQPLVGWLDVTDYDSCKIPGVREPHPIQCAIHDLGGRTAAGQNPAVGPHVLYFPDGEYAVDRTLFMEGRAGVQFVGQSSGGAVLKWTGPPGTGPDDTRALFHAEGNRDSTWRNMVWDGGCASPDTCFVVAFDQSFCGRSDLGILRSDECGAKNLGWPEDDRVGESDNGGAHLDSVFRNAYVGLRLGHYGVADDTTTVRRCSFEHNFVGASLEDFNALRHWFWDDLFEDNFVALSNNIGRVRQAFDPQFDPADRAGGRGGDFAVYRGRFVDNRHTDVWAEPTGEFIVRDSWFSGARRFFFGAGPYSTPGRYSLIGNRVWDRDGSAMETRNPGSFLLADNRIYTDPEATPVVLDAPARASREYPEAGHIDLVAIENTYSIPPERRPYEFLKEFRLREIGDRRIQEPPPVSIPPLPEARDPLHDRPIYTVTDARSDDPAANAARIQRIIDAAAADPVPAVVHFPGVGGRYPIGATLRLPPGSDLTLVGDGAYTTLWWAGPRDEPLLAADAGALTGLTVRDLQFLGAGIVVEQLGRAETRVLLGRLRVAQAGVAGILLQQLDGVAVDLVDVKVNSGLSATDSAVGILVEPGGQPGRRSEIAVWSGETIRNDQDYLVLNGGDGPRLLISGNYMEKSRRHLRIVGRGAGGRVEIHGSKLAPVVTLDGTRGLEDATATISVEDFAGELSLVESQMFVVAPGKRTPSSRAAVDHGARIRVAGGSSAGVDITALGLNVRRQPSGDDPDDARRDLPEYDFSAVGPNGVNYRRFASRRGANVSLPLTDIRIGAGGEVESLGQELAAADRDRLLAAVRLVREMEPPGYYDEPGQLNLPRIRFDKVFVFKSPTYGLVLAGGAAQPPDFAD